MQDNLPNFFETELRRPSVYVLPPMFDPQPAESPSDPHPAAGSPADKVDRALLVPIFAAIAGQGTQTLPGIGHALTIADVAPGHVMCIRKNGNPWVSVTRGLSRLARLGISQRAMTDDTIIGMASMSKPVTATAVVAMIDDWASIRNDFLASGYAGAPMTTLQVTSGGAATTLLVPTVLAPLFSDIDGARKFIAYVPPGTVADEVMAALNYFTNLTLTVTGGLPATPPGYFGLLKRGVLGAAPAFSDPVWPLIKDRVNTGIQEVDSQAAAVSIERFLVHLSGYSDAGGSAAAPAPAPVSAEPPGRPARFDLWGFIAGLMVTTPQPNPGFNYANANYNVLTALVEACTETPFDDYLTDRLFFDPRFDNVRRHVVDTRRCALYYAGTQLSGFSGGTLFSDYTDWPGNGGLYVTANQFTDWLYALYARQPVARRGSAMPQPMVVSDANYNRLLRPSNLTSNISTYSPFFGVGVRPAGTDTHTKRFQENGATGSVGLVAGNLAIIVTPGGTVYTALFVRRRELLTARLVSIDQTA